MNTGDCTWIAILAVWSLIFLLSIIKLSRRNATLDNLLTNMTETYAVNQFKNKKLGSQSADIIVVIPALNESNNLKQVLPDIPKKISGHNLSVLLIDDGSSDGTNELSLSSHIELVSMPITRGQGTALRIGYILALSAGAKIIVTMDADGQNCSNEIEKLIEPIITNDADFVIGSRILGRFEKDDPVRLLGVRVFSHVLNMLVKTKITDCSSGLRAIRATALDTITANLQQRQFQSAELIMEVAQRDFKITEVPVTIRKRLFGRTKKGNNLFYGLAFARTIFMTWVKLSQTNKMSFYTKANNGG